MKKEVSLLLVMSVLFISLASATLSITQPLASYNFGDEIYLTVTLNPSSVSGSFEINVVCGNESANVYKIAPASSAFSVGQEQKINHQIILKKEFIGNLKGDCNVVASLGKEVVVSNKFVLTDEININVKTDKYSYDPAEAITLSLDAIKVNGVPLNGFVEVNGSQNFKKEIVDGNVSEIFRSAENAEAGKYDLTLFVYDSDENGILNQKIVYLSYEIKQVAKSIVISLPAIEANPGENFEFATDLYDQSGKTMSANLSALLLSPGEKDKKQFGVSSGTTSQISFLTNSTAGNYRLIVSLGTLAEEKTFVLKAVPKITMEFLENTSLLIVKNEGNAPFNNSLNISIGENTSETLFLNVLPGEERRFNLKAPNGMYNVKVSDGQETVEKQLLLTGSAIKISEYNGLSVLTRYPLIWAFIGIV
ncbi:hypothetical protein KA107_03635, partial [Candidatus Pacearchaeota archaeon]|nr:hypothetical protein [Candidatus Pacearchaeota archaeon]